MMTDESANCTTPAPTATGWWPKRASGWAQRGSWLTVRMHMYECVQCLPSQQAVGLFLILVLHKITEHMPGNKVKGQDTVVKYQTRDF